MYISIIEEERENRHRERERGRELHESRPIHRERPRMADVPCFFSHCLVSSFAFLSRVRDLETVDRVRCNYPPFGRLAGPFRSPLAGSPWREQTVFKRRAKERARGRVCWLAYRKRRAPRHGHSAAHSLFLARTAIDKAKRLMKYYTVRIYAYVRPSL